MKQVFLCVGILLLVGRATMAQTKSAKPKPQANSKTIQSKSDNKVTNSSNPLSLNSTASYPAKANNNSLSVANKQYTITDPILTTFDARAKGSNISMGKSGIVGMPKRAYGFANGWLLFHSTGSTTFGTQTGSGGVATGTSLGTFGSNGPAMSVNGKSPYAGINMWGNAMNMNITGSDSSVRLTPVRKQ